MTKDEALKLALDALQTCIIDGDGWSGPNYSFDGLKVGKSIIAIKEALAQQEPVIDKSAAVRIATALGWEPKRKPLTDEEIDKITEQLDETTIGWSTHEFARAIEAKLKEKNA